MNHDHHASALVGTMGAWGLYLTSFMAQATPVLQFVSLLLACVASIFAIRYYWKRT